jgi:hypothetical protein
MGFAAIVRLSGDDSIAICNNNIADCDNCQQESEKDLHNPENTPYRQRPIPCGANLTGKRLDWWLTTVKSRNPIRGEKNAQPDRPL